MASHHHVNMSAGGGCGGCHGVSGCDGDGGGGGGGGAGGGHHHGDAFALLLLFHPLVLSAIVAICASVVVQLASPADPWGRTLLFLKQLGRQVSARARERERVVAGRWDRRLSSREVDAAHDAICHVCWGGEEVGGGASISASHFGGGCRGKKTTNDRAVRTTMITNYIMLYRTGEGEPHFRPYRRVLRGRIRASPLLLDHRRRAQLALRQPRQQLLRPGHPLLRVGMGRVLPLLESSPARDLRRGHPPPRVLPREQAGSVRGDGEVVVVVVVPRGGGGGRRRCRWRRRGRRFGDERGRARGGRGGGDVRTRPPPPRSRRRRGGSQGPGRRVRHRRPHEEHMQVHGRGRHGPHAEQVPGRQGERALPGRSPLPESSGRARGGGGDDDDDDDDDR